MTTTRVYKSTDTSAPVLVGGVSSLINLLDKCLVTGYGSKTAKRWFVTEVRLTPAGRRLARELLGTQQQLPLKKQKSKSKNQSYGIPFRGTE